MDALEDGVGDEDVVDHRVAELVKGHCLEELFSGLLDFLGVRALLICRCSAGVLGVFICMLLVVMIAHIIYGKYSPARRTLAVVRATSNSRFCT